MWLCVLPLLMTLHLTFDTALYSWARHPFGKARRYIAATTCVITLSLLINDSRVSVCVCVCVNVDPRFIKVTTPALGPSSLPHTGYRRIILWCLSGRIMTLVTHLQLLPKLRMLDAIHPLPYMLSWRAHKSNLLTCKIMIFNVERL
jgi:hypothetical protein